MAVTVVMPKLGQIMVEGIVNRWTKAPGDPVAAGEVIAEIETEKLNYDLEATGNGTFHPVASEGSVVAVDGVLAYLLADGEAAPEAPAPPTPVPASAAGPAVATRAAPPAAASGDVVPSTPGARRLAAKLGVDLAKVTASGPRGRIVEDDVRNFAEQGSPLPPGLPAPSKTVPVRGMRKAIADHMRSSISSTAQLSFLMDVDVTEAQRLRREASNDSAKTIGMIHVLVKASAEALKRVPAMNTLLHDGTVLYFDEANIGVAVSLDDGLIVPVLKNAGSKGIAGLAEEGQRLAEAARQGKLSADDLAGGTFTISVLGSVDGFTPILNAGQSAILGAGRSVDKPVVKDGEIVVREMMTLSLTVDHQVIDGAVAASFMRRLQQAIERPAALFKG
ncbi:MAG: dihydrolipoamide acetyltransferase family protein [Chloroflexi bacterium]|nr:dihydrolipoamide acetyltransferase family protein [Chloroflexota bacterium]